MISVNEKLCAEAMIYLDSKIAIGLIESADLMDVRANDHAILRIEGISKKIWRRVIEPEIRTIIEIIGVQFGEDMHQAHLRKKLKPAYPWGMKKRHDYITLKVRL